MYYSKSDEVEVKNYLSKDKILDRVDEESIFEMVFGFRPKEFDYVTSPFRQDNRPGCWFEYSISGRLKFIDWASEFYMNGVKMHSIDCFDAVRLYYKLPDFYETVLFIYTHLVQGKEITAKKLTAREKLTVKEKNKTDILIETREFDARDRNFWVKYGISSQNLIEDKVFAVKRYKIINSAKPSRSIKCFTPSYAYTDFEEGRKKIYSPSSKFKFITNCGKDDIGGLRTLVEKGDKLIVSKSYKDYRVLKNQNYNVIWLQNEGMFPTAFTLLPIITRFEEIIIFFDNDRAGKDASLMLVEYIQSVDNSTKVRSISLPDQYPKDPSDFLYKLGKEKLNEFLKNEI